MENNQTLQHLDDSLKRHVQQTENGVDYWLARDLQRLLGYANWENFRKVMLKSKRACQLSGYWIPDHFDDVGRTVKIGAGYPRVIDDLKLTYYACHLIAEHSDPRKEAVMFCRDYFTMQRSGADRIKLQSLLSASE